MKPYLALDTSGDCLSLALGLDDGAVLAEVSQASVQNDALEELLKELLCKSGIALCDIAGILFASGPGSFTGLRISTACVQGLCLGASLPAWPLSSLEAAQARVQARTGKEFPVIVRRARKGEWFMGRRDERGLFQSGVSSSAELLSNYAHASIAVFGSEHDVLVDADLACQAETLRTWQYFPHEACASGLLSVFASYSYELKASGRLSGALALSSYQPLYLTPVSAQTLEERQKKAQKKA